MDFEEIGYEVADTLGFLVDSEDAPTNSITNDVIKAFKNAMRRKWELERENEELKRKLKGVK